MLIVLLSRGFSFEGGSLFRGSDEKEELYSTSAQYSIIDLA